MTETTRCARCQLFAELKKPFHLEMPGYPDGVTVYGFCAKDAGPSVVSFYPVYIPDGGICKHFKKIEE